MSAVLHLDKVTKQFGSFVAIDKLSMKIGMGERHAVIGPNGAGKTTLVNLITGRYRPSSGRILFTNRDVSKLSVHQRARLGIGRSFQLVNIFEGMSVEDNLRTVIIHRLGLGMSPLRRIDKVDQCQKELEHILDVMKLRDERRTAAEILPYGLQRLLEIGMALAQEPMLIVLDEPGAGISGEDCRELARLIESVTTGKSLLLIEHDMDFVFRLSNRISVLHEGAIIAQGAPKDIRESRIVQELYLGEEVANA